MRVYITNKNLHIKLVPADFSQYVQRKKIALAFYLDILGFQKFVTLHHGYFAKNLDGRKIAVASNR